MCLFRRALSDPYLPFGFFHSGSTRGDGSLVFRFYEAAVRDLPQPATRRRSPDGDVRQKLDAFRSSTPTSLSSILRMR